MLSCPSFRYATQDLDHLSETFPVTIHDEYKSECDQVVFLAVDATLKRPELNVQAFVDVKNGMLTE
jgi:hypothetical protein